ncbi:BnaA04g13130D [Brassica napus]|uniref:BnaA04g13130D protein n=1 Tax=Brassica napus TaxID=3708 RepID=A0A078GJT9_BRANA|nr:BnaA04g13130D [Brassica napus]
MINLSLLTGILKRDWDCMRREMAHFSNTPSPLLFFCVWVLRLHLFPSLSLPKPKKAHPIPPETLSSLLLYLFSQLPSLSFFSFFSSQIDLIGFSVVRRFQIRSRLDKISAMISISFDWG